MIDKLPPHSIEAEQSVLGCMLINSDTIPDALEILVADDFYRLDHREIFEAIKQIDLGGGSVDVVTVCDLMQSGNLAYLGELAKNTPHTSNIRAYANIVQGEARKRGLIEAGNKVVRIAYESKSAQDAIDQANQIITKAIETKEASNNKGFDDLANEFLDGLEARRKQTSDLLGLTTGLKDLDKRTAGLIDSDLIVIAGRPSMGKTSLAMGLADEVLSQGKTVQIFSLEMSADQLMQRMFSRIGSVPLGSIRQPKKLESFHWGKVTETLKELHGSKLFVDDRGGASIQQIASQCIQTKRKHGLDLVIIDYLGLMELPQAGNKADAIAGVTRALKSMAKALDVPVVLLSQLNRGVDARPNKRPLMSDLRDSGAIEQDADVIMFIYRDEVYHADSEHEGVAEIIIAKQRQGEIGTVRVGFDGQFTSFFDLKYNF